MNKIRPFLKWPGGKYRLVHEIIARMPEAKRYVEPFVGSGAVFLNTNFEHYQLNDINDDLINLYNAVKSESVEFIAYAKQFFAKRYNAEHAYYDLRAQFNASTDVMERSALFLYLNRHGYNGLCRYNQKGIFNVPFGRYTKPYFPETEIKQFAEKAKRATFECRHFADFLSRRRGDTVIYCDPPYVSLSKSANFTSYHSAPFDEKEQQVLASLASRLSHNTVAVLISNHDTKVTRALYDEAQIFSFHVSRAISCRASSRKKVAELLAIYQQSTL